MKKLIKEFLESESNIINKAKEIKEEYSENIRICTEGKGNCNGVDYYYYNPITHKVTKGTGFVSQNSSTYSYKDIGSIEISITRNPGYEDYSYIRIERIIKLEDEDMSYADEYEEKKFIFDEDYSIIELIDNRSSYPATMIVSCINCQKDYIVNENDVEFGVYMALNEQKTEIICSECTDQQSVETFLNHIENENKHEQYEYYLINYIGLAYDDDLFA